MICVLFLRKETDNYFFGLKIFRGRLMYKIAVCEDKQEEQEEIVNMTKEILQKNQIDFHIFCYQSGEELLNKIQNGKQFDLLLLDVLLKGINGIELATQLRSWQNTTAIVFLSWNKEFALQGYEVEASRYLAKPVQEERLQEALLFCYERQMKKEILLPTTNESSYRENSSSLRNRYTEASMSGR